MIIIDDAYILVGSANINERLVLELDKRCLHFRLISSIVNLSTYKNLEA